MLKHTENAYNVIVSLVKFNMNVKDEYKVNEKTEN